MGLTKYQDFIFWSACTVEWKSYSPCRRHEGIWGREGLAALVLDRDSTWSQVVNLTLRPLYPRKGAPGEVSGPQSRRGWYGEEMTSCPCREWNHDSSAVQAVAILSLLQLSYPGWAFSSNKSTEC